MRLRAFLFLALTVATSLASAQDYQVYPRLLLRVADGPNRGEVVVSYREINGPWVQLAVGTDLRFTNSWNDLFRVAWLRSGGQSRMLLLLEGGIAASIPFPESHEPHVEWCWRTYAGVSWLTVSIRDTSGNQGVFLANIGDGRVLKLHNLALPINGSEEYYVDQREDGILHFPHSGLQFDVRTFDQAIRHGRSGDLLVSDAEPDLAALTAPLFQWNPAVPLSVIYHPIWGQLSGGLAGSNERGSMDAFLGNLLTLLARIERPRDEDDRLAATTAFRLLLPEAQIRRHARVTGSRPLTPADYRAAVDALNRRHQDFEQGIFPPSTPNPDLWVIRSPMWRRLRVNPPTTAMWQALAVELRSTARETRRTAQAMLRFLLGGERGVLRFTSHPDRPRDLSPSDYVEAATNRAALSEQARECLRRLGGP